MGLKVLLYDPNGEIEYLLSDIFEVTGHILYSLKGSKEEILERIKKLDAYLLILPEESKDLWLDALREKILFPFFILSEQIKKEQFLKKGFSELNLIPIPFNPLDLLNKLTAIDKLELNGENLQDLGFINSLLKLYLENSSLSLKLINKNQKCFVKPTPPSLSCDKKTLKEILRGEYSLDLSAEDWKPLESFNTLSDFIRELLHEAKKAVEKKIEKPREIIEKIEEGFLSIQYFQNSGIVRKNFYLLFLKGKDKEVLLSVGLPELSSINLLNKGLGVLGKTLNDLTAIMLPSFSFKDLEVLKRLTLKIPRLSVIGRRKLNEYFQLYGIGNLKFKAIEDIPFLKARLATGHTLTFIPLSDGISTCIKIERKLFTGKILGNFNTEDPELRKIFHRMIYPSKELFLLDIRILAPHLSNVKVYPLYGPELQNPEKTYSDLRDYRYTPNLLKTQEAIYLFNIVLNHLSKEEKEAILEKLGSYIEFDDEAVIELYTEPNIFITELYNALLENLDSPEKFFTILKELFNYGIYIPPSEV